MKKSHFCGLKMFLFCLKHGETLFLRVFWKKAKKKKNVLEFFCPKSRVTPLKNCDFWHYEKIPFLWSKNVSVLFRRWRNSIFKGILRKSKKKNVLEYFCPKSWVTPLENCDFWPYEKNPFLRSKMVSVLCRT